MHVTWHGPTGSSPGLSAACSDAPQIAHRGTTWQWLRTAGTCRGLQRSGAQSGLRLPEVRLWRRAAMAAVAAEFRHGRVRVWEDGEGSGGRRGVLSCGRGGRGSHGFQNCVAANSMFEKPLFGCELLSSPLNRKILMTSSLPTTMAAMKAPPDKRASEKRKTISAWQYVMGKRRKERKGRDAESRSGLLGRTVEKRELLLARFLRNIDLRLVFTRATSLLVARLLEASVEEEKLPEDCSLQGNWAPVKEIGHVAGPLRLIKGSIPEDFPPGIFLRNGPNPYFPPLLRRSPLGTAQHHFLEGDGMLHGTHVSHGGVYYTNRFVLTEGLRMDMAAGKSAYWGGFNADPAAAAAGFLANVAISGKPFKKVGNTSVIAHHGKVFALHEMCLPVEIYLPGLDTVGEYDFNGQLDTACTAHPKIDPVTGEFIFYSYQPYAPHVTVYVATSEGKIIHRAALDIGHAVVMHDFGITPKYTIIVDEALTINPRRLIEGKPLVEFEPDKGMRFGVLPRFGNAASIRWFNAEPGFAFHIMNSYEGKMGIQEGIFATCHAVFSQFAFGPNEVQYSFACGSADGEEVVVHAFRLTIESKTKPNEQTWAEFMTAQFLVPDGEVLTHLYEWRLNMTTGQVAERHLAPDLAGEFPRINGNYVGQKYRYGYGSISDLETGSRKGRYQFGSVAKFHFSEAFDPVEVPVKTEIHSFGPRRYGGEVTFVPRESSASEDEGWLVTYVYDEEAEQSEFYVIDAQNMEGEAVARVALPQRVPDGLHGAYVQGSWKL